MSLTLKLSGFFNDFKVFSSVHNIILINTKKNYLVYSRRFKNLIVFVDDKSLNVFNVFLFNGFSRPDEMNCLW